MTSQQNCFALHQGRWEGVFTTYDPVSLTVQHQKRSVITFEEIEPGVIRQTNTYAPMDPDHPTEVPPPRTWTYQSLSAAIRYFEDGSFSNGRLQWAPFSDFGIEQGFIYGDEKMRLVQLFDTQGHLSSLIQIHEFRHQWQPPTPQTYTPLGSWQGQSTQFQNHDYVPDIKPVTFNVTHRQGSALPNNLWVSGSLQLPKPLQPDRSFHHELAWMPSQTVYLKLIRRYDNQGSWQNIEMITAQRQA